MTYIYTVLTGVTFDNFIKPCTVLVFCSDKVEMKLCRVCIVLPEVSCINRMPVMAFRPRAVYPSSRPTL